MTKIIITCAWWTLVVITGIAVASYINFKTRMNEPPVENICGCKCDCEEESPGSYQYQMIMPEGNCGVTICCDGCGTDVNGQVFCK